MTGAPELPFWAYSKSEKKRLLQDEIADLLDAGGQSLSGSDRYLLREALGHLYAGRYELACDCLDDVHEPPQFSPFCNTAICDAASVISDSMLMRSLRYIKGTPKRPYPAF